ncbi:hypothetical protein CVT25_004295 [Psilocybe cyanescens]|uniref:Serine/threonine specific protein phosphatases domain-containing protein n=1 Tax=Psilocybe cyanescens TaxID=93625 RepID=A0A409XDY5_PSICY|nr:hypothetical protein CVT25_004295 [Psilocybe cyanescens]
MHGFENSGQSSSATPTERNTNTATLRLQTLSQSTASYSMTTRTYSAASSLTNDTDYGIQYTHRALSPVLYDSDYRQDRNQNSNTYSSPARVAADSYFPGRMLIDEVTEEEIVNAQEPLPNLTPEYLKSHFLQEGRLTDGQALHIINTATDIFSGEPNLVHIESPVTICGDICGQYLDLMKVFEVSSSKLQDNLYLFLGDYANGEAHGVEVRPRVPLCRAVSFNPCQFRTRVEWCYYEDVMNAATAVKASHSNMNASDTGVNFCVITVPTLFYSGLQKYTETVYEAFLRSFRSLPISALIDERINRFVEIGSYGLLCDLVYSDPLPDFDNETGPTNNNLGLASRAVSGATFIYSSMRRGRPSGYYTYEGVCQFLDLNDLLFIITGHNIQSLTGYKMYHRTEKYNIPSVFRISSKSNYRNTPRIPGVVLIYANQKMHIRKFVSYPATNGAPRVLDTRRRVIQSKILAIGRFMLLLGMIRCAYYLFVPRAHSD